MTEKRDYRQIIEQEKRERTGRLNLGNCGLSDWPEELFEMDWLTHLVMDSQWEWQEEQLEYVFDGALPLYFGNRTGDISPGISKLKNLVYLNLARLSIVEINGLESLTALASLDLSSNQITEIKALETLTSLTQLDLSSNQITEIKALETLTSLTQLDLSDNQITEIKALETLTSLTQLDLSYNKITEIKALETLTSLTQLYLSDNKITEIKALETLTSLTQLDLRSNKITEIKALETLTSLTQLYLSYNQITEIKALETLTSLTQLDLRFNKITEIKALETLTSLTQLDLNYNQITEIKALETLTNLTQLDLRSNKITEIKGLESLTALARLNVSENQIARAGPLTNLASLEELKVSGNPTKDFPKALHDESYDDSCINDLKAWQEELLKDKPVKNKGVKMLLTGNGNAGKSSIAEALQKGACENDKDSTHGVLIEQWEPDKNRQFHIWDFGGQEIYHGTHQLFMDSDALHLVVFDPETEQSPVVPDRVNAGEATRNQPLAYWLANVKEHNRDSPMIVVQNKADLFPVIDNAANNLANDNGCKFVHVSAKKGKNIDELIFHINKALPLINEYDMEVPASWQHIREYYLAEQKKTDNTKPIIAVDEFYATAKEFGIAEKVWPTLVKFLHNNGVIYYNRQHMPGHIIVDQRWALDAIYAILDRNSSFYRLQRDYFKGICKLQELWDAWGREKTDETKKLLLQFMRSCALCFPLTDKYYLADEPAPEQSYVFPEFLNSGKPALVTNQEEAIKTNFVYYRMQEAFLHYRTIQQLIVKYGTKTPFEYIWRNGILIKTDHGYCAIEADLGKHTLTIAVDRQLEHSFLPELLRQIGEKEQKRSWEKSEDGVHFSPIDVEPIAKEQHNKNGKESPYRLFTHNEIKKMKRLFISYSRHDEDYKEEFRKHLVTLKEQELVESFNCKEIDLGAEWDPAIQREIDECDIMICLVSVDFLNTPYIRKYEVRKAIEDGKQLIPIIIKPCDWEESEVGKFFASLRGLPVSLNKELFLRDEIKENSAIERAAFWTKVVKEFREKLFNK